MTAASEVRIREVGLRDGLQNVADFMPTAAKTAWIDAEAATGVREIEVCSFVPPKLIPQFSDAEAVVTHALGLDGLTSVALIPNLKGAERGVALGVAKMVFVLSVSESHNQANVRRSTDESVADFERIVALRDADPDALRFALTAALSTSFGCTYEGRVDEGRVVELASGLAARGADQIMLGDTVGFADPGHVRRLVGAVRDAVAPVPVACHFHDTRGLGLANAFAAYEEGVREFDASLGGLGGCPYAPRATGNVVTEDIAFMFEAMGIATGIDLDALVKVREIVAAALPNTPLHGSLSRAGLPKGFAAAD
jgi:hydroxymethylglutaryl-CoA lyase